jgi:5-formyltetrahydrofolate cyclo-ligase
MKMKVSEVANLSNKINIKLLELLNDISDNSTVGLFYPYKNEVNILALAEVLEKKKIQCLLPKVISKNKPLKYFPYSHQYPLLEKGFGGIMEPVNDQSIDPDIIIASCSAFNIEGYRVGYGGGFFDRTISELNEKKNIKTILAAFEIQKTSIQFQEIFDEKVDYICTENKTYRT